MNAAQKFIKLTWLELIGEEEFNKIEIDEDGWLEVNHRDFHFKYNRSIVGDFHGKGYNPFKKGSHETAEKLYVRPKKLNNWKENNGWIKIESFNDFPTEKGTQHWVFIDGNIFPTTFNNSADLIWKEVTHYKPIEIPQPPLY